VSRRCPNPPAVPAWVEVGCRPVYGTQVRLVAQWPASAVAGRAVGASVGWARRPVTDSSAESRPRLAEIRRPTLGGGSIALAVNVKVQPTFLGLPVGANRHRSGRCCTALWPARDGTFDSDPGLCFASPTDCFGSRAGRLPEPNLAGARDPVVRVDGGLTPGLGLSKPAGRSSELQPWGLTVAPCCGPLVGRGDVKHLAGRPNPTRWIDPHGAHPSAGIAGIPGRAARTASPSTSLGPPTASSVVSKPRGPHLTVARGWPVRVGRASAPARRAGIYPSSSFRRPARGIVFRR